MDDSGQGSGPSTEYRVSDPADEHPTLDRGQEARLDDHASRGLSDHTQKRIGLHLRAMYDTIVQQPVPDRFRDLISQLEASSQDGIGRPD